MTITSVTQEPPGKSPKLPLWKKVLSGIGRLLSVAFSLLVLASVGYGVFWAGSSVVDWWNEASEPKHFACREMAEDSIKRELTFPSTFDEHLLETQSWNKVRASVNGSSENGWWISAAMIFGVKNAFGVQTNYIVRYDGWTDTNGDCTRVRLTEIDFYN